MKETKLPHGKWQAGMSAPRRIADRIAFTRANKKETATDTAIAAFVSVSAQPTLGGHSWRPLALGNQCLMVSSDEAFRGDSPKRIASSS